MATNTKQFSSEDYVHNGDKWQKIPLALIRTLDKQQETEE